MSIVMKARNIAAYELSDGLILNLWVNRDGKYVVQGRNQYNGREFDNKDDAIKHIKARITESELYNRNES